MKAKQTKPKPPMLHLTFNWSGEWPKKLKKKWAALMKPRTFTIRIPKG